LKRASPHESSYSRTADDGFGIAAEYFGKTVHDDEVERHLGWVSPYARYGPGHRQAAQARQAR
jgi:hypothetical protein